MVSFSRPGMVGSDQGRTSQGNKQKGKQQCNPKIKVLLSLYGKSAFREQSVQYLYLCNKLVEKECHIVPGPVEVGVQVGAQEASSLEVNVAHLALLPKPVQRMLTEVLY